MSILYINTGSTANAGDGDSLRTAFNKINGNFQYINALASGQLTLDRGFTGSIGDYGYTGSQGYDGSQGFTGSRGAGYTGSASTIPGYAGSQGFTGSVGSTGTIGYTGSIGYVGSASTASGYAGSQGLIGYTGSQGADSTVPGYVGSLGYVGSPGFVGSQGVVGFVGSAGSLGYTGSQGDQGPQGFSPDTVPGGIYIQLDQNNLIGTNIGYVAPSTSTISFTTGQAVRLRANILRNGNTPIAIGVIRSDGGAGALLIFDENNILGMYQMLPGSQNAISQTYDLSNNIFGINRYLQMEWQITPDATNGSVVFGSVIGVGGVELEQVDPGLFNVFDTSQGDWYLCAFAADSISSIADVAYELGIGIGGANGYTGSAGAGFTGSASTQIGYTGSSGYDGYTGSQGYSGSVGYTGSASSVPGYTGSQGSAGSQGFAGSAGPAGYIGSHGPIGYTGSVGYFGSIGYTGSVGYSGSNGPTGYTGSAGAQGIQGDDGVTGSQGYTGSTGFGFTGSQGLQGYTGSRSTLPGPTGYTGSQGNALIQSGIAPSPATTTTIWYDTVSGRSFVYFEGNWVDSNPSVDTISLTQLKSVVAESTSFTDFQARIAAL